jgi:hypothetical protein
MRGKLTMELFVKPGRVTGMRPGWYDLDAETGALSHRGDESADIGEAFPGEAAGLYTAGAFLLLVRSDPADEGALFAAGAIGQQLMIAAGLFDLGFCPVGQLRQDRLPETPGSAGPVVHCLVGGGVAAAARRQWIQIERPDAEAVFAARLLDHAREYLPTYMVPEAVALLDRLPLGANGKIDRSALANMGIKTTRSDGTYVAPNTETEKALAEIFAEVLECGRVGALDDFFALGGNSVKAVQVFRKIVTAFNSDVQISDIFQFSRVRLLAERVDSLSGDGGASPDKSDNRSAQQRAALARHGRLRRQRGEAGA